MRRTTASFVQAFHLMEELTAGRTSSCRHSSRAAHRGRHGGAQKTCWGGSGLADRAGFPSALSGGQRQRQ